LIYVALQIRASAAATRAEARRTADSEAFEAIRRIGENADLARVFTVGLANPGQLSPEETFRFGLYLSHWFFLHETMWKEVHLGTSSREELQEQFTRSIPIFDSPGGRAWWLQNSAALSSGFRDYFEARISGLNPSSS
jgi:hypothetical protein